MKYVIFGIPGVGKSSVVEGIIDRTSIKTANIGTLMFEAAEKEGYVKSRDELRSLNFKMQQHVREIVMDKLIKIHEDYGSILVDTHAAVKTPQGYMPGFDQTMLTTFRPDVFIVLWAEPAEIIQRREEDNTRTRDEDDMRDLTEGLRITRQMASTYSIIARATYMEIENKHGKLDETIDKLGNIIKSN